LKTLLISYENQYVFQLYEMIPAHVFSAVFEAKKNMKFANLPLNNTPKITLKNSLPLQLYP